ncbi:MAG: hypothetical protein CL436_02845 [Acidimicrobiaceae bacterium]|nr:hypothetical protein [Acidimicrobiaceae bacterium]
MAGDRALARGHSLARGCRPALGCRDCLARFAAARGAPQPSVPEGVGQRGGRVDTDQPGLPFRVYRRSHLSHHECKNPTDPATDTESFFVTAATWERLSALGRWSFIAHHTLLRRMLLGPLVENASMVRRDVSSIRSGDRPLLRWWSVHLATATLLFWLVVRVAGMPWWTYLLGVYLGNGLGLVRSYCEHQWADGGATRSIVVRAGWFFRLLFLNNNLRHTHHAEAGVA